MPAYLKAAARALAATDLWAKPGNGVSYLGTEKAPLLPHHLTNNPLPKGYPWGDATVKDSNPYDPDQTPNTGVTRHYDFTVSREPCSPDGYENTCLLVNNQFPGPLIEANWGDYIEVKVTNTIPDEGTSLHWHGFLQKDTPYMDGVPGNSQCPIAPNGEFTYRFRADQYGTSWYHSHWSAQYGSGLFGPMVVYGPKDWSYDHDLGPIIVQDYYHEYYTAAVELTLAPLSEAGPPLAVNNLINGKASNSTGGPGMAQFNVKSGKSYRLRLINTSSASVQKISIDGYTFQVIANDFVPIQPYETDLITLGVGQRNDIILKATGKPTDSMWLRAFRPPPCGPSAGGEEVLAAIFYENADKSMPPSTTANSDAYDSSCANDPLEKTVPVMSLTPPEPDFTEVIPIEFRPNGSALIWYLQGRTFRIDYNDPMLLEAKLGNIDYPEIENAHNYGTNNSIMFVLENPGNQPHPMHLHGHNIWVLQTGACASAPAANNAPAASTFIPTSATQTTEPSATSTSYGQQTTETFGGPPGGPPGGPHGGPHGGPPSAASSSPTKSNNSPAHSSASPTDSSGASAYSSASPTESSAAPPSYSKRAEHANIVRRDGAGACWDGSVVNGNNPQRRDVQMLPPNSYIVIQWVQDNPGVWPLHCHIAWHLSAGMVWMVVENPDAIKNEMQIPSIMAQTCRDWSAYTKDNVVQQIDDGI